MRKYLLSLLVLPSGLLFAQATLPDGQIEVIKDFEVRLVETPKVRIRPEAIPLDTVARTYTYLLKAPSPAIQYGRPDIRPLAIDPETKPTAYPFLARVGFGNPNAWIGQAAYDHWNGDGLGWNARIDYASANNKKIPLQRFSSFQARAGAASMITDRLRFQGNARGSWETVYFYGAEDIPDDPASLRRRYQRLAFDAGVEQLVDAGQPFGYHAGLIVLFDKDDQAVKESTYQLTGGISGLFQGDIPFGVDALVDATRLRHTGDHKLTNIHLRPHLDYALGDLGLHVGANVLLNKARNAVLPDLEAEYPVAGPVAALRLGWKGFAWKNDFHTLTTYNPYLNDRLDTLNNQLTRRLYAGVRGRIGAIAYDFNAGYARFRDLALFLQDRDDTELFDPLYDDGRYIDLEGSVTWEVLPKLALQVRAFQRFYKLNAEEKPWHLPSFGGDAFVTYAGSGDLYHVTFSLHTENGLPYRTPGGTSSRLGALVDINLHGDYYFTRFLGAFVRLNNLANNKRARWVNYPSYGFNVQAGLAMRLE